jgi:hypothetical protein
VFTLTDRPDEDGFELVTVDLADLGDGRTEMRLEQRGQMTPEGTSAPARGGAPSSSAWPRTWATAKNGFSVQR